MAVDMAVAGGLGQGLMSFVQSYLQTQNMLQEQAIKKRLANAQTMDAASKIYDLGGINPSTQGLVSSYAQGDFSSQGGPGMVPYQRVVPFQQVQTQGQAQPSQAGQPLEPAQPSPVPAEAPTQPSAPSQPQGLLNSNGNQASAVGYDPTSGTTIMGRPLSSYSASERAAFAPILKSNAELATPQGQLALKKQQTDLDNSKNEQFNKGNESFKSVKDTFATAADAYGKLMKVTSEDSPKNRQSALMQVIKLDMPRQAVRYSTMEAMESDPQIAERWGNYFSRIKTGSPSEVSVNDIKTLGTNLYQANSDEFRSSQQDEIKNAKARGVSNPAYVNLSYADKMDSLAAQTRKTTPKYKAPSLNAVVDQAAPPEVAGLIKKAGSGLMAGARGLVNSLNTGKDTSVANENTGPPAGLSFEQFKAWKKANARK